VVIISKVEAKASGLRHYFTGVPCKRGHVSERLVSNNNCVDCIRDRPKTPRRENYFKEYDARRRSARKDYISTWKKENKHLKSEQDKRYREKHRAKVLARQSALRKRFKIATPSWITDSDVRVVESIYEMAKRLSDCLSIPHHVDHIVPLNGENVCGLHVPWNLAPVPSKLNLLKNNRTNFSGLCYTI